MALHGEVLVVNPVLARGVEMELGKRVAGAVDREASIGHDHLEARTQVLELRGRHRRHLQLHGAGGGIGDHAGLDVDGRLVLALGTRGVVGVQAEPVERAAEGGVIVRVRLDGAICLPRAQPVVAAGGNRGEKRER